MSDFLADYLAWTATEEPPRLYNRWVGFGVVSAALGRRVWLRRGHELIFPNLYLALVGPSGARKSVAIGLGERVLRGLGQAVTMLPDASTRRAFLNSLSHATEETDDEGELLHGVGRRYEGAGPGDAASYFAAAAFQSELAVLLKRSEENLFSDLTSIYDSRPEWEYRTQHSGVERLTGPCLTLVGAFAPDWITLMLPPEMIGGGFTARVIFVWAAGKGQTVFWPPSDEPSRAALVEQLRGVRRLEGEFQLAPAARAAYEAFYRHQEEAAAAGRPVLRDPRLARYIERRPTHLLKLAMAVAAARAHHPVLVEADMIDARAALEEVERAGMERVFAGKGRNLDASLAGEVAAFLERVGGVARRDDVLRAFPDDLSADDLDRIVRTLVARRVLVEERLGRELSYRLVAG